MKPLALALLLLPCAVVGAPPAEVPLTLADPRVRALETNIELRVERANATVDGSGATRAKSS